MKKIIIVFIVVIVLAIILFSYVSFNSKENINQKSEVISDMKISSPAFVHNAKIPAKFSCDGSDINPRLEISNIPNGTKSFVLIMDDPDAPMGTWVHWLLFNIPTSVKVIEENSVPAGVLQGKNSWGKNEYGGPCPPSGTHGYMFKLYALSSDLNLNEGASKQQIESAMQGKILAQTVLTGLYSRS